jgi:hypothetical protein
MNLRTFGAIATSLAAFLLLTAMTTIAHAAGIPVDLATRFLTNLYTGVEMSPEEWLADSTRETNVFEKSGGLPAMVEQNTARAKERGGFKAAIVQKSTNTRTGYEVTIEILFNEPSKGRDAEATQEREIWNLRVVKDRGTWRIAL